jgi:hypothetical protein
MQGLLDGATGNKGEKRAHIVSKRHAEEKNDGDCTYFLLSHLVFSLATIYLRYEATFS